MSSPSVTVARGAGMRHAGRAASRGTRMNTDLGGRGLQAMGMMLPNELVWILEKLGFEWPDIDEDEVRKAAQLTRTFGSDLEACIQAVDRIVVSDIGGSIEGGSGPAFTSAWTTTRSTHLQQLIDFMDPAATGMEVGAEVILGLKIKVIAELATTLASLIPLLAAGPLGAGGAALLIIAKKKLLSAAVDIAVEQAMEQIIPVVIEALSEQLPVVIAAILDAPLVEGAVADVNQYRADLTALELASLDLKAQEADLQSITSQYASDIFALDFGGDS